MKKHLCSVLAVLLAAACFSFVGACSPKGASDTNASAGGAAKQGSYLSISQSEAKGFMDSGDDVVILDVRTQEEFDDAHIEGAVLIPYDEIARRAPAELTDKDQIILVYCRSGNRSKTASQSLADLGYTNVKEFGGINTWEYGTVK